MLAETEPKRAWLKKIAFFLVPLIFIAMLGWVMVARTVKVRVGHAPPAFSLESFTGDRTSLGQFKGRPVIINFWASWCLPCRQEAPDLAEVSRRYSQKEVVLVGINSRDLMSKARQYVATYDLDGWIHLRDADAAVAGSYGVPRYPETFFIDRDGILVEHWRGPITLTQLSERIDILTSR